MSHRNGRQPWLTTEAKGQTTVPRLEERVPGRRRRRLRRILGGARHRAPIAPVVEESSYVGRRRAEGDAR